MRASASESLLDLLDDPGHRLIEPARACARLAPDLVERGPQNASTLIGSRSRPSL
jgi:hypothetical protein